MCDGPGPPTDNQASQPALHFRLWKQPPFYRSHVCNENASSVSWREAGSGCRRSQDGPIVDECWLVYLSAAQSLGAAHCVAQWARWKTIHSGQQPARQTTEGSRLNIHSSTQSSLASPSASAAVTRSTHSSKWCLAGEHCLEFRQSVYQMYLVSLGPSG
jgi:alkylhydroperoxidase family enzyme